MATPARKPLKAADDEPFDFNLDAVKAEVDLAPFRVHWAGRRWEMAHGQQINVWDVLDDHATEQQAALAVFEAALGDQWAEFRKIPLPLYKMLPLFEAYQKHSGIEVGESSASADS